MSVIRKASGVCARIKTRIFRYRAFGVARLCHFTRHDLYRACRWLYRLRTAVCAAFGVDDRACGHSAGVRDGYGACSMGTWRNFYGKYKIRLVYFGALWYNNGDPTGRRAEDLGKLGRNASACDAFRHVYRLKALRHLGTVSVPDRRGHSQKSE